MKKIYAFAVAFACLALAACTPDMKSLSSFDLNDVNFNDDESKMHLSYTSALSALSYDSGVDHIKVNGEDFTIYQRGSSTSSWTAEGGTAVEAEHFYSAYSDGTIANWDEANHTYTFGLTYGTTNGIILAGNTDSKNLTLTPCCAILRVPLGATGYTVKVGFEGNKVPKGGIVNAETCRILATSPDYLTGVSDLGGGSYGGQFLTMRMDDDENYYIGIPVIGNSVTTYLYLEWTRGGSTTRFRTQGQVTLERGKVYTVGTTRVSPFDGDGAGIGEFIINASDDAVAFSKGNLQCNPRNKRYCFADYQYTQMEDGNNSIRQKYTGLIDLFGWGTSGDTYMPWLSSDNNSDYYSGGNIAGNSYDWGVWAVNNSKLYVSSAFATLTTKSWRTLTRQEWTYLLGHNDNGLATITVGGISYRGLIIAPYDTYNASRDEWTDWSCPSGLTFNTGTSGGWTTNNYNETQWKKMENSGVIFLPAAGWRTVDGSGNPKAQDFGEDGTGASQKGRYWSSTKASAPYATNAYSVEFTNSTITVNTNPRQYGCAVRLVTDVTW